MKIKCVKYKTLMIQRRKLLVFTCVIFLTFLLSTYYLLKILINVENEVRSNTPSIEEKIYEVLLKLPEQYKIKQGNNVVANLAINNLKINENDDFGETWQVADSWVSRKGVVNLNSPKLGQVFNALKKAKIIKADLDTRGTQLKLLLTLEGNQNVIFKPKWYDIEKVIDGPVYAGKDRFFSEILGFYLSIILETRSTPISAMRTISLKQDILPVATSSLKSTSFQKNNNRTCIYGNCFYCKKEDPICENDHFTLTGVVVFNIDVPLKVYRSPWQRTYKKAKKANWEIEENYCKLVREKIAKQRLLDLIDAAIFDFLIQNGDRHHYETLYNRVILLDNGKGFGNPNVHHIDILAPLYQCCILRRSTWNKLRGLSGGKIREYLEKMPDIEQLVTDKHLRAVEERLLIVFATVEYCRSKTKSNFLQ